VTPSPNHNHNPERSPMRVAVPSISFCQNQTLRAELLAAYPDTRFNETFRRLTAHELIEFLDGRDAAIMGLEPLTEQMLQQLPVLKVISRMGVGVDNISVELLNKFDIRIGWTGGTNRHSVAELTICFAIAAMRHVGPLNHAMRMAERPHHLMGRQIGGRVFGLHGCGNVGKEVVRLLKPFGCKVLACDIRDYGAFYRDHDVEPVSMDEMLARSEIVSLHLPLSDTTRGLYSAEVLDKLLPGAVLLNTCRGGIVDETALKQRLQDGKIAAACFDAFAVEPPTDDELLNAPNFLCTPHIGGSAEEARMAMGRAAIDGLANNFVPERGKPPFVD
jgi:phosphoglycerate dehydrogenase-like enzyme